MIELIFTVDYEIYGNGEGSLTKLVYEPAERLRTIFNNWGTQFVVFAEVAELEMIEANCTDLAIKAIKKQLKELHQEGYEIGLHIHPWWYNGRYEKRKWNLDFTEYNLCSQPSGRISQIIDRALDYIRRLLCVPDYTPISFRAGHLLFQPTQPLSNILAERGIKLDSSVYKGGLWRQHNLDYRLSPKGEAYWKFTDDVTKSEAQGLLIEVPIYTYMAPIWDLFTFKRVSLQRVGSNIRQTGGEIADRLFDFMRYRYPKKFDLGQMTKGEMVRMIDRIIREDRKNPSAFHPIVIIMHTKDPIEFEIINSFLGYVSKNRIRISTFSKVLNKIEALYGA